uniref:Uncharacterized protein n=1 Tax=Picea glauca TaxID=3330 RepID=A0A101M3R1_PICGL|nr:hypothetical protein ABT39_MTgene192 [Picea glauca]QHR89330.1 hypothetical protein Q903MT_gene3351 [Picea sitchensis]
MYRKPELLIEWTQNQLGKMFALMLIGQELGKVMDFMLATKLELVKLLGVLPSLLSLSPPLPLWVLLYPNLPRGFHRLHTPPCSA